jgi:hypothetical protein
MEAAEFYETTMHGVKNPEKYHLCKKIIPKVDFKELLTL